jgi:preprotein translocase subunit YajC
MISTILFLAQQAPPAGSPASPPSAGVLPSLLPFVFMIVIFYFLLIRPQQRRQKEQRQLLESLKTGDKVITSSGIHGLIANVKDNTVLLKIADNVKIEVEKSSVATVSKQTEQPKTTT